MEIKFRKYKNIYILDLLGEFDLYNTNLLFNAVKKIKSRNVELFIINLANVSYIDSSGIGALIKLKGEAKLNKKNFMISGASSSIMTIFEHGGLDSFFNLQKDVRSAIIHSSTQNEVRFK